MNHDKLVGRPMEVLLVEDDLEDAGLTIETLREGARCPAAWKPGSRRRSMAAGLPATGGPISPASLVPTP